MKLYITNLNKLLIIFLLSTHTLFALGSAINYLNPFQLAFDTPNTIIYGDYASISSSVECIDKNGKCDDNYGGYLFNATTKYKNDAGMALNSSTQTLALPSDIDGSDIIFAGLYWQANITGADEKNYNTQFSNSNKHGGIKGRDTIKMLDAKGASHDLKADKLWYHDFWGDKTGKDGGHRSFYQGFKNVTTILQDSYTKGATNTYSVGNIKASAGKDYGTYFWVSDNESAFTNVRIGFWGHWNLIVVYQHSNIKVLTPQPKPKNVAIFHGFEPLIPLTPNTSKSINVNVSGFLTPKQAPVNAKMLFYGAGGEKKLTYDTLEIQDKKTTNFVKISNATNPINGAFNGSVSSFGVPIDNTISYYPGLDSDEFNVSNVMQTTQSTTILRLTASNSGGTGDQFFPGVLAFSTDVYEPQFCYDYAYKQLNKYFTEDNDGSLNPRIAGAVAKNTPVSVSIYLKNLVSSDVQVEGMQLSVLDINTSQAVYTRQTTSLALNTSLKSSISDNSMTAVADGYIKGIPIGNLSTDDYFYTYYDITPLVTDVNMTLNVNASYNLKTSSATIPYNLNLSSEIPMCSVSSFQYTADKGEFNLVHTDYYNLDTGGSSKYYNLPTQITNRVGNFKVISIDENETLTPLSAMVGIETIDAAAFHSAYVSCQELDSSLSQKVWMLFDTTNALDFNKSTIDQAIVAGRTALNPSSDLYKYARENAAFRTSSPVDSNGTIQLLQKVSATTWKVKNFSYNAGQSCVNSATTIGTTCGSDGAGSSSAMTESQLAVCMECIYGISTKLTCSRDNFAIRPDSFSLQINDNNQSSTPKQKLVDNITATPNTTNLAAGYQYNLDINATNFLNISASSGYTKLFGSFNFKDTMQYLWSSDKTALVCNDIADKAVTQNVSFRIANGDITMNLPGFSEVGKYQLNIVDTSWSSVDNNTLYMQHHNQKYPDGSDMFLKIGGNIAYDCVKNSSKSNDITSIALNGCNISSDHNNSFGNVLSNISVQFKPYKFDLENITPSVGLTNTTATTNTFIYMANISQDENMSFHLNGKIKAVGYDGSALSNFVTQCYAEPLTLDINKSIISVPVAYKSIFHVLDANSKTIRTSSQDLNTSTDTIAMNAIDFPKDLNGVANTQLNLNFDRKINSAQNPQEITFRFYHAYCSTAANCTFNANLITDEVARGVKDLNNTLIKHYYGRTHAPRQRFVGTNGSVNLYYEVYCNGNTCGKSLLQDGLDSNSTDDPRWFINTKHSTSFGDVGTISQKTTGSAHVTASTPTNSAPATATITYDTKKGYPYKATMNMNASTWLIYNPYSTTTTANEFEVEFTKSGSPWTGVHENTDTTTTKATDRTNRRLMW